MNVDEFIERRIVTGMIVSTRYLQQIHPVYNPQLLNSSVANLLATWCMEYFQRYNVAPNRDIEGIYTAHVNAGLNKDQAEGIELVLESLSGEYKRKKFNVDYLLDQTYEYFQQQHLRRHIDEINDKLSSGTVTDATAVALGFAPVIKENNQIVDPFENMDRVEAAFKQKAEPLITFPKALGDYWNDQLTRDAFVAFLGPEKIGKSFWLIEFAMRGVFSDCNVALFQAGDMSEDQMLRRLGIYITKRSDKAKYCEGMFVPVLDCVHNQKDICHKKTREGDIGIFDRSKDLKKVTADELADLFKKNPEYQPCHNCPSNKGAVWLKWRKAVEPLTGREAVKRMINFRRRYKKRLRICTYPNETLTTTEIKSLLDTWERQDNFVPDLIIIDYADILAPDADLMRLDYRNQQNKIWQRLRRLSQQKHCLLITATQAAATSYKHETLKLEDFSETKTKYAHVTAMYGLNQLPEEKKIGLMRLNELVVREGDFDRTAEVHVLQKLQMGRPFIGSFR